MGRAAFGIIRVSQRKGREGESFISPADQRRRLSDACRRDDLTLAHVVEEIDISGGLALDKRHGLREAIEAVEAGQVQVVVVAYFDRLFRSIRVQAEVVSRVEAAGGEVLALDFGRISEETAAQWLSGTVMGAFGEYFRRSAAEKGRAAQVDAISRGVPTFPTLPPGLEKGEDGRLRHTSDAETVVRAFELRAEGATIAEVRRFLGECGIPLTYRRTQGLFSNRLLTGELKFGDLVNPRAVKPVVDRELFNRVQRVSVPRGRKPKSDRLLARLGVLRCGTCGGRLVVGTVRDGSYPFYRCTPTGDCPERVTISARKAEAAVISAVKAALADVEGRASLESRARRAEAEADEAQKRLDSAIRAFADFSDEVAAQETLATLKAERDAKVEAVEQLGGKATSITFTGSDWDRLTLAEQRDLIRATVERVDVAPGRGADRLSIHLFV